MTNHKKVSEDIKKQYHLWGTISEYVNIIDAYCKGTEETVNIIYAYHPTT